MANIKFSAFDATDPVSATIDLVAAKSGNNIRFTPADLAPFTGIYAANGTIGTTRKALITDTIQFRNAGDTSDIFTLNTNGTFALGKGATAAGGYSAVSIGGTANAASNYSVSIGNLSDATSTYAIAIGGGATGAQASGQDGIAIGGNGANASGNSSISVGYSAVTSGDYSINIGRKSRGTGDNAITFNASTDAIAAPSTANAFGVYMTSNTTPDFQIAHDGNSFITGTGNFGIGTSSPLYTLDTKGSVAGNWLARVENDSGTGLGLQVKVNSTDSTKRTFSTRNANGYTMSVYNDGVVEINGQAYTEQHGAPLAGATIDWDNSNVQYIQLASGANTLSLSNPKSGATYILQVKQPSSGAAGTITYPTSVKYPGGIKAVLTTDNDAIDIITLIYNGTTTHYYASATLDLK